LSPLSRHPLPLSRHPLPLSRHLVAAVAASTCCRCRGSLAAVAASVCCRCRGSIAAVAASCRRSRCPGSRGRATLPKWVLASRLVAHSAPAPVSGGQASAPLAASALAAAAGARGLGAVAGPLSCAALGAAARLKRNAAGPGGLGPPGLYPCPCRFAARLRGLKAPWPIGAGPPPDPRPRQLPQGFRRCGAGGPLRP